MKNSSPLRGKPSTGEPDAGEAHVRFGGRGDANQCVVPTPIDVCPVYGSKISDLKFSKIFWSQNETL